MWIKADDDALKLVKALPSEARCPHVIPLPRLIHLSPFISRDDTAIAEEGGKPRPIAPSEYGAINSAQQLILYCFSNNSFFSLPSQAAGATFPFLGNKSQKSLFPSESHCTGVQISITQLTPNRGK